MQQSGEDQPSLDQVEILNVSCEEGGESIAEHFAERSPHCERSRRNCSNW